MQRTRLTAIVASLAIGLVALAPRAAPGEEEGAAMTAEEAASAGVVFTLEDAGGRATVPRGAVIELALAARPGTGYTWRVVENDPTSLEPLGEPVLEEPRTEELGGATRQVFRFRAAEPGTVALELRYLRPWEEAGAPADVFRLTLEVE